MRSRVLVSAAGVPVILLLILWAPLWALAGALAALAPIGGWELMRCVGAARVKALDVLGVLGAVCSVFAVYFRDSIFGELVVVYVLLLFAFSVWQAGRVRFQQICVTLLAMFAIPYAFASLLQLGALGYSRSYMLLPLIFSFSTDTCAFFAGHAFGKHKLAPHVSPHKTVEGALGGIVGSVTGGLLFALVVNTWGDGSISYPLIALVGVLISLAAQLGDLSFSLIKREFGVKDYGHIFLAHGGVLDRFDSVIFAAPTLLVLLQLLRL